MTDTTPIRSSLTRSGTSAPTLAIAVAALLGFGMVFLAGFAQAGVLHDVAHDVRHATGFPCH